MVAYSTVEPNPLALRTIIVGGGASLKGFDFMSLRDRGCYIIAVNDAAEFVPFADAWFTVDPWGLQGPQLPSVSFNGTLFAAVPLDYGSPGALSRMHRAVPTRDITYVQRLAHPPIPHIPSHRAKQIKEFTKDRSAVLTGNSVFSAMNLAVHMGAKHIAILGVDGGGRYFYKNRNKIINNKLGHLPRVFNDFHPYLYQNGIRVFNGSPTSKVTCFPRSTPERAVELVVKSGF
jgi:hypothetical protein